MRCNSCWRELEGRAITTTCGHLLCPEDANKILSSDGACPICDQVLSKSLMKPVDISPNDEWVNMVMAGISPQILMKSAYRSVMFYIGQRDLEMQFKMNKVVAQCRQKCETMQEKFTEKLEQIHSAYQKMTKRCQMMEQEMENLSKDKQELQEKFSEKCRLSPILVPLSYSLYTVHCCADWNTARQKRKLDEMYDQARSEIESIKRSAIQPANHYFSRPGPDLFSNQAARMDNRDPIMKGPREDMWAGRQNSSGSTFDISGGSPAKQTGVPIDTGNRMSSAHPSFGIGSGTGASNPSMTLRNLVLSPLKRPQLSRSRPQLFTL
ncbi:E3 ubiquitin-protein ligase CCNB1IP1 homolog isoform X2 [Primulina huaijiensis]|uniref:E3 ubiquitin-protein ligase CCNB1IP1 homolog isoform X2 n=1 Tax=Primulina huaijiensis TaxID=1492673 RepID=UPI003CC73C4B